MATQNSINAPFPFSAIIGGTGVASPTIHGILIAQGSSPMNTIVLTAGQVLVGTTASDPVGATITGSAGVTVTSTSGAIAIAGSGTGITWVDQASASVTMAVNTAYVNTNATLVTYTLPTTAAEGSIFGIVGKGAGGWTIAEATGQTIHFGNVNTTITTGTLASQLQYDVVWLVCVTANTSFVVYGSVGNLSYT